MLRVCFPWSQENLYIYIYIRGGTAHVTNSHIHNQPAAGLVTKAQARAWWWNRHSVDLVKESICQVLITASSFYLSQDVPLIMDLGFDVPSQKKTLCFWDSCVWEQRFKQSAKQWTLFVFPQYVQWVEFPVFPYEGCLLAVRSVDSAGESGKIWRWNQLVSCFPYLSCESLFVIGLRTTGRTY